MSANPSNPSTDPAESQPHRDSSARVRPRAEVWNQLHCRLLVASAAPFLGGGRQEGDSGISSGGLDSWALGGEVNYRSVFGDFKRRTLLHTGGLRAGGPLL